MTGGNKSLVIGHWSIGHWSIGHWSLVIGQLVIGHWSLGIGHWSLVIDRSLVIGHWYWSFQGVGDSSPQENFEIEVVKHVSFE